MYRLADKYLTVVEIVVIADTPLDQPMTDFVKNTTNLGRFLGGRGFYIVPIRYFL